MANKSKKILTEISAGELLDKISILEIKLVKIKDKERIFEINKEYKSLIQTRESNINFNDNVKKLFAELKQVNLKLWDIENNKRMCEKNKDFGEKFIKLSRNVHFLNDERAKIKLEINNHTGSKIKEIKEYTNY